MVLHGSKQRAGLFNLAKYQVSWEKYRDTTWLCRDEVRKARVWLEVNLTRDTKNNNKGFYGYVRQKKVRKIIAPLMKSW